MENEVTVASVLSKSTSSRVQIFPQGHQGKSEESETNLPDYREEYNNDTGCCQYQHYSITALIRVQRIVAYLFRIRVQRTVPISNSREFIKFICIRL